MMSIPALLMADGTTKGEPLRTQVVMMLVTHRSGSPGVQRPQGRNGPFGTRRRLFDDNSFGILRRMLLG
jgi:hypothetical protein